MTILERALRMGEARQYRAFEARVAEINGFEPELELSSDEELRAAMDALRERSRGGAEVDELLPASIRSARQVDKLARGTPHLDVQVSWGMGLHSVARAVR